jgi:hypothetical protein
MARTMPHVEQGVLTVEPPGTEGVLRVGTPAWFGWLETATVPWRWPRCASSRECCSGKVA